MALPTQAELYEEADRQFFAANPDAPRRLDPDDPAQAHLVQDWLTRRDQILNGWVDGIFASFFPYAGKLDPNDPGDGTLIEYWLDIRDSIRDGKPSHYNWNQPPTDTSATSTTPSTPTSPTPTATAPTVDAGPPSVPVHMDENEVKEYIHAILEGEHYVGHTAEVIAYLTPAEAEGLFVSVMEGLGVVGMVASTALMFWEVIHAFGTGLRLQEQEGFCYGIMWQVAEMPDQPKQFVDWLDDSATDLRDAFYGGVAEGREKAAAVALHNRVVLATTYYQLKGSDLDWARFYVLNDLWQQVRESEHARDRLEWPKPADMQPLIP